MELTEVYEHAGKEIVDVQARGEYVYAALGKNGIRIYDNANIENKDFSERIVTAPVSSLGQRFYLPTKDARAILAPVTTALDPTRVRFKENEEGPIHLIYGFIYVADAEEGLIVVGDGTANSETPGVSTLLDGEPRNNFLKKGYAFNPDNALKGARRLAMAGWFVYVLCDDGLAVVSLEDILHPKLVAKISAPEINDPRGISLQFRYGFVVDKDGMKTLDITDLANPKLVPGAVVKIEDAHNITTARTYAYVAGGHEGMVIVDIEHPEHPVLDQVFNAGGELKDTHDIKIGMVSASQFALVADGKFGFKVIQLISPETVPNFIGFSPRPAPRLIAWRHTKGPAVFVSRGVDRDRAVDESGNQLSVFGRRGSRPFNLEEMHRLYLRDGQLYTVTDAPPGPPVEDVETNVSSADTPAPAQKSLRPKK